VRRSIGRILKLIPKAAPALLKDRFDEKVHHRTGLWPIHRTDPEDIFIVGYPKSGNTWMQYLVASVLFGTDSRLTPDSLIQDLVPDVHSQLWYRRYRAAMFFKSHHLPRPEYRRVIYLVRDGRDAMVSYFHFLSAINRSAPDFLKMVSNGEGLFPCRWHEHVNAWMKNPYEAKLIMITYESLKANTVAKLKELCAFAEIERTCDFLKSVALACSFDAMREKEKKMGWHSAIWPTDKHFVRRGEAGSFKDEMPADVLSCFLAQAGDTLRICEYV
jgi:hypothetical protein